MNERHCEDLLAGYALGALDDHDHQTAAEHLAECEECRNECAEFAEALHRCFGENVPLQQPNPLLRTQILARFALDAGSLHASQVAWITAVHEAHLATDAERDIPPKPARPEPQAQDGTHPAQTLAAPDEPSPTLHMVASPAATATAARPLPYGWAWAGTGVAAAAAVLFAILFANMKHQYDDVHSHLFASALAQGHVAMVLTGPAVAHHMAGEVLMPKDGTAGMLIVHGIPASTGGTSYTCWVQRDGRWIDYGTLHPDASGLAMMMLTHSGSLHQSTVAITAERAANPPAPSGPQLLSARL